MKHDDILNFTLEWPNVQLKSKSQRPSQISICSPKSLQNVVFYSISLVCCTLLNCKIIERWTRNLTFEVPYQSKRKGEKDKGFKYPPPPSDMEGPFQGDPRKTKVRAGRFSAYLCHHPYCLLPYCNFKHAFIIDHLYLDLQFP